MVKLNVYCINATDIQILNSYYVSFFLESKNRITFGRDSFYIIAFCNQKLFLLHFEETSAFYIQVLVYYFFIGLCDSKLIRATQNK